MPACASCCRDGIGRSESAGSYRSLHGASIRVDADGMLVLPLLAGRTLATLLEDPELDESIRRRAMAHAAIALAEFHRVGFTHGDAMAENVLVDLDAGIAHWFDWETIHDRVARSSGDVQTTCEHCSSPAWSEPSPEKRVETLEFSSLDVYADEDVTRVLATSFTSVWRRSLTLHLLQARLSFQCFCEIGRFLLEGSQISGPRDRRISR